MTDKNKSKIVLPPDPLPALKDLVYGGYSPYAVSPLRDVCGCRINPDALEWYSKREFMKDPNQAPLNCANPLLASWLQDVNSFDPSAEVKQRPREEWPLNAIIPRISVWGTKLPFPHEAWTYLIDYRYLNSRPGKPPERKWVETLTERFPEGSRLILGFFGNPELNGALWGQGRDFWELDFLKQFTAIIAPDFAAYGDDPIPESLLGERMVQIFCTMGSRLGHNLIPTIAWRSIDSFRRQVDFWTGLYPDVHTIQLDCDGFGVNPSLWWWRWIYAMEKYCKGFDNIRWLITGRPKGWVLRELNEIFPAHNYAVLPSVALYNGCLSSSRGEIWMRDTFGRKVRRLEAFWSGEVIADRVPRPDFWPQFRDCLNEESMQAIADNTSLSLSPSIEDTSGKD